VSASRPGSRDHASVHTLRGRFAGERAVVVLGGPSIVERGWDLGRLAGRFVVFLEARALTPRFLSYGLAPDFYMMFYPEKCKANALQGVVFQALLAGIDLRPLLREEWVAEVEHLQRALAEYCEPWRADVAHKRLRWKPDVYLKGSPFDLMSRVPGMACLTYAAPFRQYVREQAIAHDVYAYDMEEAREPFSAAAYYDVREDEGRVVLRDFSFSNSSAIALFPLLKYLGFRTVYLVGMDMSMLGSMEYASLYTFRSLAHFRRFFEQARAVFSANYPRRFGRELYRQVRARGLRGLVAPEAWRGLAARHPWFIRPYYEFDSLRQVLADGAMTFVNVHEPWPYARPVPGVPNVGFEALARA
jgi:hypothetical protein